MLPIPKSITTFLIALISLASYQAFEQDQSKMESHVINSSNLSSDKYQRYDLSIHEKIDPNEKLALMQKVARLYPQYSDHESWPHKHSEYFHFMDLDLDGDLDLIFDGWSGAEPMMVEILLQIDSKFESKFKGYVDLVGFKVRNEKLQELTIYDPGCCGAIIAHELQYEFKIRPDSIDYWLIEHLEFHNATTEPEKYYETPIPFEVVNTVTVLRIAPRIDSLDSSHPGDFKGNVYQTFQKGDKGYAYAEMSDATGKTWWYVYMDTKNRTVNKVQYPKDYFPKYKGWMNSNYLKRE